MNQKGVLLIAYGPYPEILNSIEMGLDVLKGGPQGERSESYRVFSALDAGYRIKSGTGPAGMTN